MLILAVCWGAPETGQCDQWKTFEHRYAYKLEDVLPATKFVPKQGYWEGYRGNSLVGYVGISKDWTKNLVGYSGKHLETLVGMDKAGVITGAKLVFHSEPIVLIGLKEESLESFLKQYAGKNIRDTISVGGVISIDALTGATVSAVVENTIILETLRKIAARAGIIEVAKGKGRRISQASAVLSWSDLTASGAVKNIVVTDKDLGISSEADVYLEVFLVNVAPPAIGKSLLGDGFYAEVMGNLKKGETPVAIFSQGKGSFKGTGFVRGGVFDRFNVEQGTKQNLFRDKDYRVLSELRAKGAPVIREGGIFIIRDKDFDQTIPFKFNLLLPYRVTAAKKEFKSYSMDYSLPERFME